MVGKNCADWKTWNEANPTPELRSPHLSTRSPFLYVSSVNRLYNGMIHGLEPYTLRGVLCFQADGNMGHPFEYSEMI